MYRYNRQMYRHNREQQVATELMQRDALEAHARDELGLSQGSYARPMRIAR
jgi:hypothetical protein